MTLEEMWNLLKGRIPPKSEIQSWSPADGYLGETFSVVAVKDGHIHVVTTGAERIEKVPDQDFVTILGLWNDYVDGKVAAKAVEDRTRFPNFVVSILHSLESPPQ